MLNRRRPEGKELTIEKAMKRLTTVTVDELVIDPLYTADDVALGYPSVTPFTRGTSLRTGTIHAWDITTCTRTPTSRSATLRCSRIWPRGATSLWLRVDPDAIAPSDLAGVLAGVIPELARLRVTSRTQTAFRGQGTGRLLAGQRARRHGRGQPRHRRPRPHGTDR